MKKIMIAIACVLALGLAATNAKADILQCVSGSCVFDIPTVLGGNGYFVGLIIPSQPAGDDWEFAYVTNLIGTTKEGSRTLDTTIGQQTGTHTYNREFSSLTPLPVLGPQMSKTTQFGDACGTAGGYLCLSVDFTGNAYFLGKWDGLGDAVFLAAVTQGDTIFMPAKGFPTTQHPNGLGLSHITVYGVPDGGVTLMLLGGALVGLEVLRRRSRA